MPVDFYMMLHGRFIAVMLSTLLVIMFNRQLRTDTLLFYTCQIVRLARHVAFKTDASHVFWAIKIEVYIGNKVFYIISVTHFETSSLLIHIQATVNLRTR